MVCGGNLRPLQRKLSQPTHTAHRSTNKNTRTRHCRHGDRSRGGRSATRQDATNVGCSGSRARHSSTPCSSSTRRHHAAMACLLQHIQQQRDVGGLVCHLKRLFNVC
jgi:hypothetical protein